MSREYEILYIIKPNLGQEEVKKVNDDIQSVIKETGGEIITFKDLGVRELGTEFKKNKQGHYALYQFKADNAVLTELNEKLRVTESVLRFIIIKLESSESANILDSDPQKVSSNG
mgnify:CR=1 FL=1|tara:strand:+ start:13 stop:357 length:345 start_codon:yes stop_codon:yes gene_type:complete